MTCFVKRILGFDHKYFILILMITGSLLLAGSIPVRASEMTADQLRKELDKKIEKTAQYEKNLVTSPACDTLGGEWTVIPLARSGYITDEFRDKYLANLRDTLVACNGQLHARKYTEFSRVTLALASLGLDPSDIFGYNMLSYLADYDNVIWQGVNGPIYALLAIDSRGYELPSVSAGKTQASRENLIARILDQQLSNGGWNLGGKESDSADADITAMALQALAPYSSDELVAKAIKRGTNRLSWMQKSDGGYVNYSVINSESCAQVVIAMAALGIDPDDSRFTKNGHTVLERMLSFYKDDGSFSHVDNGSADMMSTDQGYLAMVAVQRYLNGDSFLYDMKDREEQDISEIRIPEKSARKSNPATTSVEGESTKKASVKKIKVTKLVLNRKKLRLKEGKTAIIRAKVRPSNATNKAVTWKSSNKRIASVNKKGKVRAIRAGTVYITAMARDGSKKKAVCKVTVKKAVSSKSSGTRPDNNTASTTASTVADQRRNISPSVSPAAQSTESSEKETSKDERSETSTQASAWSFDGESYVAESTEDTSDTEPVLTDDSKETKAAPKKDKRPDWLSILTGFLITGGMAGSFTVPWKSAGNKLLLLIGLRKRKI